MGPGRLIRKTLLEKGNVEVGFEGGKKMGPRGRSREE